MVKIEQVNKTISKASQLYKNNFISKRLLNTITKLKDDYKKSKEKEKIITRAEKVFKILELIKKDYIGKPFNSFKQIENHYKVNIAQEQKKIKKIIRITNKDNKKEIDNFIDLSISLYRKGKITKNLLAFLMKYKNIDVNKIDDIKKITTMRQYKEYLLSIPKDYKDKFDDIKELEKYYEDNNETIQDNKINDYESELKNNRKINEKSGVITQNIKIKLKKFDLLTLQQFENLYLYEASLLRNIKKLNSKLYENNKIINATIKPLLAFIQHGVNNEFKILQVINEYTVKDIKYSSLIKFEKNKYEEFEQELFKRQQQAEGSDIFVIMIGYKCYYFERTEEGEEIKLNDNDINNLLAFNASNDRKFHNLTTEATHNNKICIYESFLSVNNMIKLKYRHENEQNKKEIFQMLKDEGEEIEKFVKNGLLIESLTALNKKYNKDAYIIFYNDINKHPLYIDNNDKIKTINTEDIKENTKIYLYDEHKKHIAPSNIDILFKEYNKTQIKKIEKDEYILRPTVLKDKSDIQNEINKICNNMITFDLETYNDNNDLAVPYCCCIYGYINYKLIKKSFYGINCINEFIDYIYNFVERLNCNRSRPKEKVDYIKIYGFNNSRFDNLLIYKYLYEKDNNTDFIFAGSSIKYIKHHNIEFYDIAQIYNGVQLRKICKDLGFEKEKGIYPYTFVNEKNLYYIGEVPNKKYFNSDDFKDISYDDFKNKYDKYDLKNETIKYCLLDCELTYLLCKEHINNTIGIIDNKKYNVSECKTSAGLSLRMFNQVFQNEILIGSEEHILNKEKIAYYGGRTELFKKEFISDGNNKLHYYDINSSYPSSMTKKMPLKYIRTDKINKKLSLEEIVNTNLYGVKSYKYLGNNKIVINNLIERDDKGTNYSVKNFNGETYHWGCELIEAIKNNFEVEIFEINKYEPKEIFDKFSNYFYDERKKIKKSNPSKALYYKYILNSLYGKFGQKQFEKNKLVKSNKEIWAEIKGNINILKDIEKIDDNLFMISYEEKGDNFECVGNLTRFSSYISALSRCKLSELMRDIGHENIYYCDTDSIFTIKKPSSIHIDNDILGKWKEEEENGIKEAYFVAPKLYYYKSFDNEECKKGKGIRGEKIDKSKYISMIKNNNETETQSNIMFFRSLNGVIIKNQERTIKAINNKRIFNGNESYIFDNYEQYKLYN